jgi:hypothetical protein
MSIAPARRPPAGPVRAGAPIEDRDALAVVITQSTSPPSRSARVRQRTLKALAAAS